MIKLSTLPGEGLSDLACNKGVTSPKRFSNGTVKGRGSADETVVIVKLDAGDDMVTYLRIKHSASDQQGVG